MNKEKYKRQYEYYSKHKKEIYEKHKLKMQNDEEYKNKRKQMYRNWYEKYKNKNKHLEQDLYIALNKIDKAKEYIKDNFTNDDGTIWHEEMKIIYEILGGNNE